MFRRTNGTFSTGYFANKEAIIAYIDKNNPAAPVKPVAVKKASIARKTKKTTVVSATKTVTPTIKYSTTPSTPSKPIVVAPAPVVKPVVTKPVVVTPVVSTPAPAPKKTNTTTKAS